MVNVLAYSHTGSWYVPKFDRGLRLLTFVIKLIIYQGIRKQGTKDLLV
jgi:hypothetical protein